MSSLYTHPQLYDRMKDWGPVDRYIRAGRDTYEHVISVGPVTADRGMACHLLSLDLVDQSGNPIHRVMLALYPWQALAGAESDAQLVGRKLSLCYRRSDPQVGWQVQYDPDGPALVKPTDPDFVIG